MNKTFFNRTKQALAQERLDAYGQDGADHATVLARYLMNIAVSEALYSPLQLTEVALRNGIHRSLTAKYGNDWYDGAPLSRKQGEQVVKVKEDLLLQGKPIESGRVIAELNFGFWVAFFSRAAADTGLAYAAAKKTFPQAPKQEKTIAQIHKRLDRIRKLRNRVFHHERIIHWRDLASQHQDILLIIRWMSPELAEIESKLDRFTAVHGAGIQPWKDQLGTHWPKEPDSEVKP